MPKIAMILSGCGHLDGAEIRESVLSLLFLDQAQIAVDFFAPDIAQRDVINAKEGQPMQESRNVMVEAARIARGNIAPLSGLDMIAYDGLVIPGGFGVAKNLSDFVIKGSECQVLPEFQKVIHAAFKQEKPIVAICIAPAVLAAALKGVASIKVTVGEDQGVASAIEAFGSTHVNCPTDGCVVDKEHKIVTCSAYMRNDAIANIADGIEKSIKQLALWLNYAKSQHAA